MLTRATAPWGPGAPNNSGGVTSWLLVFALGLGWLRAYAVGGHLLCPSWRPLVAGRGRAGHALKVGLVQVGCQSLEGHSRVGSPASGQGHPTQVTPHLGHWAGSRTPPKLAEPHASPVVWSRRDSGVCPSLGHHSGVMSNVLWGGPASWTRPPGTTAGAPRAVTDTLTGAGASPGCVQRTSHSGCWAPDCKDTAASPLAAEGPTGHPHWGTRV